jgi:hypothetical protein
MKRFIAVAAISALGALGLGGGVATAQATETNAGPAGALATASHSCSSGYTHARTPGGHKCLRSGQFCSHKRGYAKAYRKAGHRCKANGRLARR